VKVSEIMTPGIQFARPDETIQDVALKMIECNCGAIPVVEGEGSMRLMGVITDRDIVIRCVAKGLDPTSASCSEFMTTDIETTTPDASIEELERIMSTSQVRRVPILDENGSLVGMVSQADLALAGPKADVAEVVQDISKPYIS
jgi:CBS domain-containing protein